MNTDGCEMCDNIHKVAYTLFCESNIIHLKDPVQTGIFSMQRQTLLSIYGVCRPKYFLDVRTGKWQPSWTASSFLGKNIGDKCCYWIMIPEFIIATLATDPSKSLDDLLPNRQVTGNIFISLRPLNNVGYGSATYWLLCCWRVRFFSRRQRKGRNTQTCHWCTICSVSEG